MNHLKWFIIILLCLLLLWFIRSWYELEYTTLFEVNENLLTGEQWELGNQWEIYKENRNNDDPKQKMIQYAYEIWGMDHVILIECENSGWDINWKWDWWDSIWLCQINRRWHKPPIEFYIDYKVQVDYCLEKRKSWTLFYAPEMKNKEWIACMVYAKERFIFK